MIKVIIIKGGFYENATMVSVQKVILLKEFTNLAIAILKTFVRIIESQSTPDKGIDLWKTHLLRFGLGNYLGYDLPVGKPGFIP